MLYLLRLCAYVCFLKNITTDWDYGGYMETARIVIGQHGLKMFSYVKHKLYYNPKCYFKNSTPFKKKLHA